MPDAQAGPEPDALQRAMEQAAQTGARQESLDDIAADDAGGTAMAEALDPPPTDQGAASDTEED